jgi:CarD family transcriptional regulator
MLEAGPPMKVAEHDSPFQVGDKVIHPHRGPAEVVRIEEREVAGERLPVYVLRILDTDRRILVPVGAAASTGLRRPVSEPEIREIFLILRQEVEGFGSQTWNRRYRALADKLKTGSIFDVAEVLRDLSRLKAERPLSFGERRMYDLARSRIVQEIAVSRAASEEAIRAELARILDVGAD